MASNLFYDEMDKPVDKLSQIEREAHRRNLLTSKDPRIYENRGPPPPPIIGRNEGRYDPYEKRQVQHPTSNLDTLIHLLKGSLGTGVLSMHHAFYNSGYVIGIIGTVLVATLCTYCVHMLIHCEYELCLRRRVPSLTYQQTLKAAVEDGPSSCEKLAPASRHVANFFLLCYQIGSCCIYVVFVASNVKDVVERYTDPIDIRIYMLFSVILFLVINYIRNLKYLSPLSTVANIVTLVGFAIILYYIFRNLPDISERHAVGALRNWPLFFGTVLFSLESIGVVMPLENEMKDPKSFVGCFGILNRAMVIIATLYIAIGFFGYLKYGEHCLGSITLDLPRYEILGQTVKIIFTFSIFVSHALQCYVAMDILLRDYLKDRMENCKNELCFEFFLRTMVVLLTIGLAAAIPNLESFISLIGTFCLTFLALFCPAVIETCTYWNHKTGSSFHWMWIKNLFIIILSVLGSIIGCYTAVKDIIRKVF